GYVAAGSYDPQGNTRITSITDGTSNTILLAHRYAQCTNANYALGGSVWGYSALSSPDLGKPMASPPMPAYPGFQIPFFATAGGGNAYPGGKNAIGYASLFQSQPAPFTGTTSVCDPFRAQTPHTGVLTAGMADGSVRGISSSVSPQTWWYACTPTG